MDTVERNQLIDQAYKSCQNSLANLLANIQPAAHSTTPLGTLTEQINQDMVALKIVAQIKQTTSHERSL